jgi:hypothetical protein
MAELADAPDSKSTILLGNGSSLPIRCQFFDAFFCSQDRARLAFECRIVNDSARISSTIPGHINIVAIALLSSWQPSFAQPTPDQIAKAKALAV